jgi:solute carrier family 13 (sodium-dependent dicarboxylate transporter), member 2/3/5
MPSSDLEIGSLSTSGKLKALILGPILGLIVYFILPDAYTGTNGQLVPFSHAGKACLGMTVWMATWWLTEAIPIAATAMLPLVMYPLLNITTAKAAMVNYASGTIFLFLGGFLLAAGIHRWHLDRRIALMTMLVCGTKPNQMILGLTLATAVLSAWVSNTATAAMMVPIAIAVLGVVRSAQPSEVITKEEKNFGICVLLSIAFAASIGGMATLIGSPPNGIYARFVEQTYGTPVSFVDWLKVALPVTVLLLPASYILLTKFIFPCKLEGIPAGKEWVKGEIAKLGPMSRGEKIVLAVFAVAAVLWIFGPVIRGMEIDGAKPFKALSDSVIAMGAGLMLFVIPVDIRRGVAALDWGTAKDVVSWDVLLLFGGGLTMAAAIQSTGAAALIGAQATVLAGTGETVMIFAVAVLVEFLTGFTSNTALAATMMPLIAAAADSLQMDPHGLLLTTALAASSAFMLPVSTPPNAIVFGTGRLRVMDMVKAGLWLNVIAAFVITFVCRVLG